MFVVGDLLISDDLAEASFSCHLSRCLGACCVQGAEGAPLEPQERANLEAVYPTVKPYLRPEAIAVIEAEGVWEEVEKGRYATTCVDGAECVFVTYEGKTALCAIQKAYQQGEVDWPKPISCHLYPIRIRRYAGHEVMNYEKIDLCASGRTLGKKTGTFLSDYLQEPLTRKYGASWYQAFKEACSARRTELASR